jgi:RNA polymerase sigma-70 factor, ECF subfamily
MPTSLAAAHPARLFPAPLSDQALAEDARRQPSPLAAADLDLATDATLTTLARNGEDHAFEALISRHKDRVASLVSRFTSCHPELEDLCQVVFLRAWRGLPGYQADAPFSHWLLRIATNACRDHLRRQHRRRFFSLPLSPSSPDPRDPAPDRARDSLEAAEVCRRALRQLAPDDQLILTLRELEDRSVEEVASLTGWSQGNVRIRALRARQRLRTILLADR